jgi:hypothetical protein
MKVKSKSGSVFFVCDICALLLIVSPLHFRFFITQLSTIGHTMDIKRFDFSIHEKFVQQCSLIVLQLTALPMCRILVLY